MEEYPAIAYIWQGAKKENEDSFYAGSTSQGLKNRLCSPIRNNYSFQTEEDIKVLFYKVFDNKEEALQCEAGFIHFLKTLHSYGLIKCLNQNNIKYNYYIDKPKPYQEGMELCNEELSTHKPLLSKIRRLKENLREKLKSRIGLT